METSQQEAVNGKSQYSKGLSYSLKAMFVIVVVLRLPQVYTDHRHAADFAEEIARRNVMDDQATAAPPVTHLRPKPQEQPEQREMQQAQLEGVLSRVLKEIANQTSWPAEKQPWPYDEEMDDPTAGMGEYARFVQQIHPNPPYYNRTSTVESNKNHNGKRKKQPVVLFICDERYSDAVAMAVASLRNDGAYYGDAVVILEESDTMKRDDMYRKLRNERPDEDRTIVYTTAELMGSLFPKRNKDHPLWDPPRLMECLDDNRKSGHTAYYRKMLMFHPTIALQWDIVLFLDGCTSFHLPLVNKVFDLSTKQQPGKVLAALDLWRWRRKPGNLNFKGQLLPRGKCTLDRAGEDFVRRVVHNKLFPDEDTYEPFRPLPNSNKPRSDILNAAPYMGGALVLYDTSVVRNYKRVTGSASSTIVELLQLFHFLGNVFRDGGDQNIQSVYWMYLRPKDFAVLEREFWDDGKTVAYLTAPPWKEMRNKVILSAYHFNRSVCTERESNRKFLEQPYGYRIGY
mmetsp:Transcript_1021/g.1603  ORF Transcript_1021/g.1603 Transcript_1021/m.1603 type:complete len:512 (-) Transcript_1021:251-1786(-)